MVSTVDNKIDRDPVYNYRPVFGSISIWSEVMENCIHNHDNIITINVICSEQHEFLKSKSCSSQVIDVFHKIGSYLDS